MKEFYESWSDEVSFEFVARGRCLLFFALLIVSLPSSASPQPYSRQESQQDIVLGGDMPISSIQATIAKLSIRPPSVSEPDGEPTFGGEEPTFPVVTDLAPLGEFQSLQHSTEAPPPPPLSPPFTSPTDCEPPPPPNGVDGTSPGDTPPVSAVASSASPPPALSSLELLASLTPEAFSMEGGGKGKQRVTKQSFLQAAEGQGLQGSRAEEGDDPLCSLDPLWTLNKQ